MPGQHDRVGAGQRVPAGDASRAERAAGARDGGRCAAGDGTARRLRRCAGLDRRDHPANAARDPDRDVRAGPPPHPPPGGRVRRGSRARRRGEDLRGLRAELPVMSEAVPRLRAVESFPVEHEGRSCIALRDPGGYTNAIVLLHGPLLEIVSLFDGAHSVADIQAVVMRRHGQRVERRQIEEIAEALDEQGFLDSPSFADRRAVIDASFLAAPTRPAAHAGAAYAGEPGELRAMLDGFFAPPDGPGRIDGAPSSESVRRGPGAAPERRGQRAAPEIRGVIAPHIDYHRGGPAYAWAYRELAERSQADLFVILVTCHAGMEHP